MRIHSKCISSEAQPTPHEAEHVQCISRAAFPLIFQSSSFFIVGLYRAPSSIVAHKMDPVSILSLVSASLTITMRAATIGKDLHSLMHKFAGADKKVRLLSVHVSAVRLAARSLSSWLEEDSVDSEEVEEIKGELLEVLAACCEILSDLQDHVSKIQTGAENIGFKGSLQFIWDEDIIGEATQTLHQQEVAMLLILEVLKR